MARRIKTVKSCKSCKKDTPHHQCRTGDPGCLHCSTCGEMSRKRPLRANDSYSPIPIDQQQLAEGAAIESSEHHVSAAQGRKIASEHMGEDANYYTKLAKLEKGQAMWGWDGLFRF